MSDRLKVIYGHLGASTVNGPPHLRPVSASVSLPPNQFKYTQNEGILSPAQRSFYEENGFLVIRNLVPRENLQKYRERFQQICRGEVRLPGLVKMKDISMKDKELSEDNLNKIQNFQVDDELFDYCCHPAVVPYVKSIISPNIMAAHTMLINKPPDSGSLTSRHPMHQDLHYFPFRPAERIVCSWTAMEKVTRANGCLVVVPGTHTGELLQHSYPKWEGGVNKMYHGIHDYNPNMERFHLEMEAGDTVFFHPLLIHGSGTNRTKGYRKAISCHFAASECHYLDIDKTSSQANIADEVREQTERVLGKELAANLSFADLWKFMARHVAGKEPEELTASA